jgi:uroporphyrinogen III methyltransferase/synthase
MKPKVFLVGAGPGDPGLITVKGMQCIQAADVIIYDYLAHPSLLKYSQKSAELIYVGKKGGDHTLSQDQINDLIVAKTKPGKTVTRLKGGDPYIFGRGGEEAEVLMQNGISFEIVPGVTSAIATQAYAGIPLTHRQYTSTVAFVTGHEDPTKDETSIDWEALARGVGTLVFFMGVKNLPSIIEQLIANGKAPDTPVALVRWGTTPRQVTVSGTLENIVERVKAAGLKAPAIIVVGEVVGLRDTLKWFEDRPLLGKRIIVTRAREQASDLINNLADLGADCLECPTIKIMPPEDEAPLNRAIQDLANYDWIVFTSVNGVAYFFKALFAGNKDVRALNQLRTAAIGPATAKRLLDFGLKSDIVPETYRAESVVEAFRKEDIKDKKKLLPRAAEARPVLPVELTKMGAQVHEVAAYRTIKDLDNADILINELEDKTTDMVTFTSSSTVKNFKEILPADQFKQLIEGVTVASIGPITTDTAIDLGFTVDITAEEFTIAGLCGAILNHYQK